MPRRALLFIVALLLLLISTPTSLRAQDEIRVGIYQNAPLIFTDSNGDVSGIYADLLDEIAEEEGWTIAYVPCDFVDCLTALERDELDLMTAIAYSPERTERFDFTRENVLTNWGQIYTLPNSDIAAIPDLEGRRIAVLQGDIHTEALRELLISFDIHSFFVEVPNYDAVFDLVMRGAADAGLTNRLFGLQYARDYVVQPSAIIFNPIEIGFAAPAGRHTDLLAALDRHLAAMKASQNSPYYHILDRWLIGLRSELDFLPDWISWILAVGGGLLALFLGGNVILRSQVKARTEALESEISERKQIEQTLRRRQRELESLLETSHAISSISGLKEVLRLIAEQATALLEADECVIFRLEETESLLHPLLFLGENEQATLDYPLAIGEGITGYSVAHNQPLMVNNAQNDPRAIHVPGTPVQQVEHLMVTPLTFRGSITGAMLLNRILKPPFTEEDLHLLIGFAQQAVIALENARLYQELEEQNLSLERAVEVRTADLKAANERLQALTRLKDDFVSNVSHELRTPITSLKLRHYLIAAQPEKADEHLRVVGREIERLEHIIEDLLFLSRLDQDRVALNLETVRLADLIRQYVSDRALLAEIRGLSLQIEENTRELPLVEADRRLLGQALSILLTNAFNYTPSGGKVTVSTHSKSNDETLVGFTVRDTGVGISPDEQPRLFERFFRGHAGQASGQPGTGLGLCIAREIVERHRGHIEVFSTGIPGEGAAFTIWLPAA